jgi:hypothetical protein
LSCETADGNVNLTFTPPAGAAEIDIVRDGELVDTVPGTATSYTDTTAGGAEVNYVVTPYDAENLPGGSASCFLFACPPVPDPQPELVWAFQFGDPRIIGSADYPVYNEPDEIYTKVLQTDTISAAYDPVLGYGYEVVYDLAGVDLPFPIHSGRGGWEIFGPFDDSPNNRNKFPDISDEQIYDTFIGCKTWFAGQGSCNEFINDPPDMDVPCAEGNVAPIDPDGIIFRVDVPNGSYRFVGAFGDADNVHAHRILAEDGGEGPPIDIGDHVVLVHNFDQAQQDIGEADAAEPGEGVFARVGFGDKIPPPGDGVFPSPQFVNMDDEGRATDGCPDSPVLEVTQGYIRIHQLQANSNTGPGGPNDPNGGDAVVLEIWSVGDGPGKPEFHRGDSNGDGKLNITDGIFVLNWLFLGGEVPGCLESANANDAASINITTGIYILNFLFLGGAPPPPPGPVGDPCGPDPAGSPSDLGCITYDHC